MWLYSCASKYDSAMKAQWLIGRDSTLLALCCAEWTSWLSSEGAPTGPGGLTARVGGIINRPSM